MSKPEHDKSDDDWKERLDDTQYNVLRCGGTEAPFSGKYWNEKTPGVYHCAGCDLPLYSSDTKYDSGSGWPSFYEAIASDNVEQRVDRSYGMARTELLCAGCGGHLGHVFKDGPQPTGMRHCINSASLTLEPSGD